MPWNRRLSRDPESRCARSRALPSAVPSRRGGPHAIQFSHRVARSSSRIISPSRSSCATREQLEPAVAKFARELRVPLADTSDIEERQQLDAALLADHDELLSLHQALLQHPLVQRLDLPPVEDSQQRLAWQLTSLLPLPLEQKNQLLAIDRPEERLQCIGDWLQQVQA